MDHTVGYVLLAAAAFPFVWGAILSLRGLGAAESAAKKAQTTAIEATAQVAAAAQVAAQATGADAERVANATVETATNVGAVQAELGEVNAALAALTGPLAPARVAFAISVVLATGALFALGVISASAGSDADGTTLTVTTG